MSALCRPLVDLSAARPVDMHFSIPWEWGVEVKLGTARVVGRRSESDDLLATPAPAPAPTPAPAPAPTPTPAPAPAPAPDPAPTPAPGPPRERHTNTSAPRHAACSAARPIPRRAPLWTFSLLSTAAEISSLRVVIFGCQASPLPEASACRQGALPSFEIQSWGRDWAPSRRLWARSAGRGGLKLKGCFCPQVREQPPPPAHTQTAMSARAPAAAAYHVLLFLLSLLCDIHSTHTHTSGHPGHRTSHIS